MVGLCDDGWIYFDVARVDFDADLRSVKLLRERQEMNHDWVQRQTEKGRTV